MYLRKYNMSSSNLISALSNVCINNVEQIYRGTVYNITEMDSIQKLSYPSDGTQMVALTNGG